MNVSKGVCVLSGTAPLGGCSQPWLSIPPPPFPVFPCASKMTQLVNTNTLLCLMQTVIVYLTCYTILFVASMQLIICSKAVSQVDGQVLAGCVRASYALDACVQGCTKSSLQHYHLKMFFKRHRHEHNCYIWKHWQAE